MPVIFTSGYYRCAERCDCKVAVETAVNDNELFNSETIGAHFEAAKDAEVAKRSIILDFG